MIRVERVDYPDDPEWVEAVAAGRRRRDKHLADAAAKRAFKIDAATYKRFASSLRRMFRGKCAYCDQKYVTMHPDEVEHYRPKGRVVTSEWDAPLPANVAPPPQHSGYFWLAYEWTNLFPSCVDCNRGRYHEDGARRVAAGKASYFPIRAARALQLGQEALEGALLVNPCDMDPADHLTFADNGYMDPRTYAGEVTIKLLGLNVREGILEMRANAFRDARNQMQNYVRALVEERIEEANEMRTRLNACWEGHEPHTAMQRRAITATLARLAGRGLTLSFPLPELQRLAA